jgi:hypothetical protein
LVRAWGTVAVAIPAFSLIGGQVRSALLAFMGPLALELGLVVGLAGLLAAAGGWYPGARGRLEWGHLAWLLPLMASLPLLVPQSAAQVHLMLFGTFGFLSVRRLGMAAGLTLAVGMAGLDELLQLGLPYRVGDWRDVALNAAAVLGGAGLARWRFPAVPAGPRRSPSPG